MFDLANPPPGFVDDPFPHYDRLLVEAPVCPQPDGSVLICKHADLNAIYRDTTTYISDKKAVFAPKFGRGTPLYEHHTTSLVFNDPPLHSRVRRIMTAAGAKGLGSHGAGVDRGGQRAVGRDAKICRSD